MPEFLNGIGAKPRKPRHFGTKSVARTFAHPDQFHGVGRFLAVVRQNQDISKATVLLIDNRHLPGAEDINVNHLHFVSQRCEPPRSIAMEEPTGHSRIAAQRGAEKRGCGSPE